MLTTLVLWDIDHTLLDSGPAGPAVYPRAFRALTGSAPEVAVPTEGRTEQAIMGQLLEVHGIHGISGAEAAAAMVTALRELDDELRSGGRRLPGSLEALTALRADPRAAQSLLTGNLRPNAHRKLAAFGLDRLVDFDAGAYGSDHPVRARLVAVAQRRASDRYGMRFGPEDTVLVGDTLRDVAAGVEGGARVVAVATGNDGAEELLAAGAETVLPDLRDTSRVVGALLGGRQRERAVRRGTL
ncbi:HAD family hydrolase [Streptomyces violaceorubidus]|uniref:HAD hydrolase-like protein n=1 Tax=Streptomyces violaceorubidus TaxID=284042 RepID=A0ABV1T512_9ACTN